MRLSPSVRAWLVAVSVCVVGLLGGATASAQVVGPESGPLSVEVHAFASQGFILTTGNDYLVTGTTRGSFQMSEVGINFTRNLTERLRAGVQLFAQNFGPAGDYTIKADWFYLDYRWRDWLGIRGGRLKIPFGFFNEVNDIDSARIPILLPQSVYPLQTRSFLFAQTGAELYGFARSRLLGALDYRLYFGTIFIDPSLVSPPSGSVRLQFDVPYVAGGRLLWETPLAGLRVGGSVQKLKLDVQAFVGPMIVTIENNSLLWVASADYVFRALAVTAEYSRWHSKQESNVPTSNIEGTSERAYVMASLGLVRWLQTSAYYALYFPDVTNREGPENRQHDVALTLRFDVNAYWLVKLEGHYMAGTAGLASPLRVDPPMIEHQQRWAVFLLKTTASF